MIVLTKLNGDKFYLNAEYIEFIEMVPDTVIVTKTGKRVRVKEKADEIVAKVVQYKREINQVLKVEYRYSSE